MIVKGRQISVLSIIAGVLLLTSLLFYDRQQYFENYDLDLYDYAAFAAALIGVGYIVIGIVGKKKLHIITLISGLFFSVFGTTATYNVIRYSKSNTWSESTEAVLILLSGLVAVAGALIVLFRKPPVRFEFDFAEHPITDHGEE